MENQKIETVEAGKKSRLQFIKNFLKAASIVQVMAGEFLLEVKERRLYELDGYKDFKSFCESELKFTTVYCHYLIKGFQAYISLPPEMQTGMSERAARELIQIPEFARAGVVDEATKGGTVAATSGAIKKAAKKLPPALKKKEEKRPAPKPAPKLDGKSKPEKKPRPEKILDGTGIDLPQEVQLLWSRSHEVSEVLQYISAARSVIVKARKSSDELFSSLNFSIVESNLDQAYQEIKTAKPFALCPVCMGKLKRGCSGCKGSGLVSEFFWTHSVSQDVKDMREKMKDENDQ